MVDFEAEVRNGMKQLTGQVSALTKELTVAKTSAKEVGEALKRHFDEAERAAKKSGHEIVEVGHALKGLGGPLGEIAHVGTNAFRFEGGLQRVALAASAAGIAFEALRLRVERSNEEMREAAELSKKMHDAVSQANERDAKATLASAEQQAPTTKTLAFRLHNEGLEQAKNIAANSGISMEDASLGVSDTIGIRKGAREAAIKAAAFAATRGEGSFPENMKRIVEDPVMQRRLERGGAGKGWLDESARLIAENQNQTSGVPITRRNIDSVRNNFSSDADGTIDRINAIQMNKNKIGIAGVDALRTGEAAGISKRETNNEMNLVADVIRESGKETQGRIDALINQSQTFTSALYELLTRGAPLGPEKYGNFGGVPGFIQYFLPESAAAQAERLQRNLNDARKQNKPFTQK